MPRRCLAAALVLIGTVWAGIASAETRLVMFERDGCIYCARWMEQVGDAYDKTAEGRAAPLRIVNLRDPIPEDLTLDQRVIFTPTFVLTIDGQEVSRLEGYASEDFFWGLLGMMLTDNGVAWENGTQVETPAEAHGG